MTQSTCLRLVRTLTSLALILYRSVAAEPVPDKTVVLTFDDAVKSHRTFVGPLLREYGFGATFFVTALWMSDTDHFMSWTDIAELHEMGFEIGNHSWSHSNFGHPRYAAHLAGQLALVENELKRVGVPKPISFAWCGNTFGPEGVAVLARSGYRFARRGMQPEVPYGTIAPGPLYEPAKYHPLLIPSAGDAYPNWTLDDFKRVVDRARDGKIAVVQFHGVPDVAHPWVHTPPERFQTYMDYLKDGGFHVIAVRDLARFIDEDVQVTDGFVRVHYGFSPLDLPAEALATQANPGFWLDNMLQRHKYTLEEAASVFGWEARSLETRLTKLQAPAGAFNLPLEADGVRVLPYPGGRHTRIGFLDGAIDPMRGTKASVFAPWDDGGYAVIDVPEAIFSNLGLLFLAHTHVPSIWDGEHRYMENVDWRVVPNGALENNWVLPNGVSFGVGVEPHRNGANVKLWLMNGTDSTLTGLRTQICVLLKGLPGFEAQSLDGKIFRDGVAAAPSADKRRWILVAFERCGRIWGNERCPCIHSDPVLPDCAAGERVEVRGRIEFLESAQIGRAIDRLGKRFKTLDELERGRQAER